MSNNTQPPTLVTSVADEARQGLKMKMAIRARHSADCEHYLGNLRDCDCGKMEATEAYLIHAEHTYERLANHVLEFEWQPITTAPRDSSRILIYCPKCSRKLVREAWWCMPYEGAPVDKCWWETMDGMVLSADVHKGLGATHWIPLPSTPSTTEGE